MSDTILVGGCMCGNVRYLINAAPLTVIACHCSRCRRQSGGAYSVNLIIRASTMEISGPIDSWDERETASGAPLDRQHCGQCGSPIRSVPSNNPKLVAVKLGSLDDPSNYSPLMHIWCQSKLPWVIIPDDLPSFAEEPV